MIQLIGIILAFAVMAFAEPFLDHDLTVIPMNIRVQYRYDGDSSYYRMTGTLQLGMSGGPNFTTDGRIGGMNKSISTVEHNTSNLVNLRKWFVYFVRMV